MGIHISTARDVVGNSGGRPSLGNSALVGNVLKLLERTEYRRCETGEDLEAIYRLRYKAYRPHGFVTDSNARMVKDSLDELPNSHCFGIFIDNRLVATVRLHQIDRQNPHGPVTKGFGDVMMPLIEQGASCINPSMFAADPELNKDYRVLPYVALRLVLVGYSWFRSTYCACLIRQEHTAFYRRIFGAREMAPPRSYPPISIPLMLYGGVCAKEFGPIVTRFPFFLSTRAEQKMLFAPREPGATTPLTVLPTAKYQLNAA